MPQRSVATNFTFEQQRQEINLLAADFWTQKGTVDTAASTYLKHDGSNDFTGQTLAVPAAFTINSNSGNGTVTISGNLDVTGTTTTVSSANLEVTDKNILIAKGSTSDSQADGAGITIDSATDITWNFIDANDAFVSSIGVEATTHLKAARGQFTGDTSPTTGSGVEINAPDANTGQIIAYNRGSSAYNELRLRAASVGIYGGTSNALVGTFNSTGLDVTGTVTTTGQLTGNSSNSGKYVRMYGSAGTGRWDIYGHGANLRFSDNDSAGNIVFDRNVDANGGLDTTNITATGDINLVDNGTLYGGSTAANVLKLTSTSGNVNHSRIEVGTSEASDNGGIHFYTAGSTSATRRITIKGTSGNVGIGEDSPADRLVVQEAQPSDDVGIRVKNDTTTDGDATNPTTASLYLNTSTADFNTFYIQARRNDNNTHLGYANPRDTNHIPFMCLANSGQVLIGSGTENTSDRFTIMDPGNAFMSLRSDAAGDGVSQHLDFIVTEANRSSTNMVSAIRSQIPTGSTAGGTLKGELSFWTNEGNSITEQVTIKSDGHVLPGSDNAQDLGSSTLRWANVYTGDMHLNNMNTGGNDVDGSEGHWTMQEGSDDLSLINRNTGKKYKFNLTEVS